MIGPTPARDPLRVLLVDHDREYAASLAGLACFVGADVTLAKDLAEARVRLERDVDLAVVDHWLPDGSGTELLAEMRRRGRDVVAVMVTSFASVANTAAALNEGAFAFVTKDCEPERLKEALDRAVERAWNRRENRFLRHVYDGVFAALPVQLVLVDPSLRVVSMNRLDSVFWLRDPGGDSGEGLLELLSPDVRDKLAWSDLARAAQAGCEGTGTVTIRDPARGRRIYDVHFLPVRPGSPLTLIRILDLTERIELERRLSESESLATVGRLTAAIAHEMRNPIAGVRVLAQLLLKRRPAGDPEREDVEEILALADRMAATLADLLDFAKPGAAREEPLDVVLLLERVVRAARRWPAAEARRLSLHVDRADRPIVRGAPHELFSAIANLVENALHAVAEGGRVEVRLAGAAGSTVEVRVEDSGPGVDPADVPRMFEPFFSHKTGGTGLGLAIVKKAIDGHGGSVEMGRSARLGGACFTIELPAADPAAE